MQLNPETIGLIVISLLAIIKMVVDARTINIKTKTATESKERTILAETKAADAETARKKVEAEMKERSDLLDLLKNQTEQNKGNIEQSKNFLNSLEKLKEEKEEDYQTLKNIADSNTAM